MLRKTFGLALIVACGLALVGCDRCGDPVKLNFPGASVCSDTK